MNTSTVQSGLEIDQFYLKDIMLPEETQKTIEEHYINTTKANVMEELRRKEAMCTAQIEVRAISVLVTVHVGDKFVIITKSPT